MTVLNYKCFVALSTAMSPLPPGGNMAGHYLYVPWAKEIPHLVARGHSPVLHSPLHHPRVLNYQRTRICLLTWILSSIPYQLSCQSCPDLELYYCFSCWVVKVRACDWSSSIRGHTTQSWPLWTQMRESPGTRAYYHRVRRPRTVFQKK